MGDREMHDRDTETEQLDVLHLGFARFERSERSRKSRKSGKPFTVSGELRGICRSGCANPEHRVPNRFRQPVVVRHVQIVAPMSHFRRKSEEARVDNSPENRHSAHQVHEVESGRIRLRHFSAHGDRDGKEQETIGRIPDNHREEDAEEAQEHARNVHFAVARRNSDHVIEKLHRAGDLAVRKQRRNVVVFRRLLDAKPPAFRPGRFRKLLDTRSRAKALDCGQEIRREHSRRSFRERVGVRRFAKALLDRFPFTGKFRKAGFHRFQVRFRLGFFPTVKFEGVAGKSERSRRRPCLGGFVAEVQDRVALAFRVFRKGEDQRIAFGFERGTVCRDIEPCENAPRFERPDAFRVDVAKHAIA